MSLYAEVSHSPSTFFPRARRILVVDDFAFMRKIVRNFLQKSGFVVCGEAGDGVQAIEQAAKLKPDLIVTDLAMPKMNGIEAACIINRDMPDVVIVAFTLYEQNFKSPLAAVVSKNDGLNGLLECIRSLLFVPDQGPS